MTTVIPFCEPCERNKDPILEVITPYLHDIDEVLEIGSGTAQHAVYFASALPHLRWQTSDQAQFLEGIKAQLNNAQVANALPPFELDVNQPQWLAEPRQYRAVYTANSFHIMSESDIQQFFSGLPQVTSGDAILIVYGPFSYHGQFTSQGNLEFDQRLRDRREGSGIRDIDFIEPLANAAGFNLLKDHAMPANNQILVWQRQ